MKIKFATISDIHFGAFNAEVLYEELLYFIKYIDKDEDIKIVFITGDYFENKLNMNSKHAKYAIQLFKRIVDIMEERDGVIRVIQGTLSHDNNQLEILDIASKGRNCDIKFITTVESEFIKGMNVLYIPEEYIGSIDEYYKDYFNNRYDMIFGHGMVQEVSFCALEQESAITMSKAPIFKSDTLLDICDGMIYLGHIHTPQVIKRRIKYVGSYSRWMHGEEDDKGFYVTSYNTETKECKDEFILNKLCRKFTTIEIYDDSGFFMKTPDVQINFMRTLIEALDSEFIRFKISIPEYYENTKLTTSLVNESFSNHKNVKVMFIDRSKKKSNKVQDEKTTKLIEKYGFIFDKTIDYETKISSFIKEKYGRNIPIDRIRTYIFGDTLK